MIDGVHDSLVVIGELVRICVVLVQPLLFDAVVELSRVHLLFYNSFLITKKLLDNFLSNLNQ